MAHTGDTGSGKNAFKRDERLPIGSCARAAALFAATAVVCLAVLPTWAQLYPQFAAVVHTFKPIVWVLGGGISIAILLNARAGARRQSQLLAQRDLVREEIERSVQHTLMRTGKAAPVVQGDEEARGVDRISTE